MSDTRPFPIPAANTPPPLDPGEPGVVAGVFMLVSGLLLGAFFVLVGLQTIKHRRVPGNFFSTPVGPPEGPALDELDAVAPQGRGATVFWLAWGWIFFVLGLGLWGVGLYGLAVGLLG